MVLDGTMGVSSISISVACMETEPSREHGPASVTQKQVVVSLG